jgi:hypothetical protein
MNFFPQTPTPQKRKRDLNDDRSAEFGQPWKRHASLAVRTPPKPRARSAGSLNGFNSHGPLTPVDSSDEESSSVFPFDTHDQSIDSRPSAYAHTAIRLQHSPVSEQGDTDMASTPAPPPTLVRIGRTRSNDIISPPRLTSPNDSFLMPAPRQPNPLADRVPTPTVSHFDSRVNNLPSVPRHSFPPLRKFLSPMIEQDGWGSPLTDSGMGLPSPAEDEGNGLTDNPGNDPDVMMGYEQTSNGMSGLRVSCDEDDDSMMDDTQMRHIAGFAEATQYSQGQDGQRTRLHMGFLAGCDKCMRKELGHYSHILRY